MSYKVGILRKHPLQFNNLFSYLKDKQFRYEARYHNLIEEKPELKIFSNHIKNILVPNRYWNSHEKGQAIRDNRGWYKSGS